MKQIILASASPKRKELLEKAGLVFEVVSSDYEEDMTLDLPPDELVRFLSLGKAKSVANKYDNAIIISADTILYSNGKILGKPHTEEKAKEMLKSLSRKTHSAYTGFTVMDTKNKKIISKSVETKITFRNLSDDMVSDYIKAGNPLEYAGSFTLRDVEARDFIERVEGDHNNVIGLPVGEVMKTLKEFL